LVVESLLQKKKRRERKEAEGGGLISWLRLSLDGRGRTWRVAQGAQHRPSLTNRLE
jgi:hypothetical protein